MDQKRFDTLIQEMDDLAKAFEEHFLELEQIMIIGYDDLRKKYKDRPWFRRLNNNISAICRDFYNIHIHQFEQELAIRFPVTVRKECMYTGMTNPTFVERFFPAIPEPGTVKRLLERISIQRESKQDIEKVTLQVEEMISRLYSLIDTMTKESRRVEEIREKELLEIIDNEREESHSYTPIEGEKILDSSFTLEYELSAWTEQRISIDLVQNHLAADSRGTWTKIRFQTRDGVWHDIGEIGEYSDEDIGKIEICDDGQGYGPERLVTLASGKKDRPESAGRFGEGMKTAMVALLKRKYDENNPNPDLNIQFRSVDWVAEPIVEEQIADEHLQNPQTIHKVKVRILPRSQDPEYEHDQQEGVQSATTIINPTPELIKVFRELDINVLGFSNNKPVAVIETSVGTVEILDYSGGRIYVKGLLIPGDHGVRYSYNFKDYSIQSRERDALTPTERQKLILAVLHDVRDEEFAKHFLRDAADLVLESGLNPKQSASNFEEFRTWFVEGVGNPGMDDFWIKCFREVFGDKTAVRSETSQDMNAVHKAEHVGLRMITLPHNIASALRTLVGSNGDRIVSYEEIIGDATRDTTDVDYKELTEFEKKRLALARKMVDLIELDKDHIPISQIKIYKYADGYEGARASGYYKKETPDTIYICIDTLRDIEDEDNSNLGRVIFHELAHQQTGGAEDPDIAFRDWLAKFAAQLALDNLKDSVDSDEMATGVTPEEITKLLLAEGADKPDSPLHEVHEAMDLLELLREQGINMEQLKEIIGQMGHHEP